MRHFYPRCRHLLIALLACSPLAVPAQDFGFAPAWPAQDSREFSRIMEWAEDYKDFMHLARSEMWFVREGIRFAEAEGFREWTAGADLQPGSRWYAVNRDRTLVLFVIGRDPLEEGIRIVNSHIDSPRIEFKTRPLRETNGVITVDAQVHGGIKNYQWVNIPLAMIGRVDRKDGSTVWVESGLEADDPVLLITDLAPHVDSDYRSRTQRDVIRTEELNPIIASLPAGDDFSSAQDRLLALLKTGFGIDREDLLSADIQIVPATQPRDVGLDRALVAAYGQDDRASAYASLRAIAEVGTPAQTVFAYAVNNEETASWNTGVNSEWFSTLVAELIAADGNVYSDLTLRRAFGASVVLVSDTTTALNPLFPSPQNPQLTSRLGHGMVIKEYGAGREANSEYFARIRNLLDEAGVHWQTHSYDAGYGGSTIAAWFATQNMEVIDVGVGLVSMHSPFEVASKVDLWELYRGFSAFYGNDF